MARIYRIYFPPPCPIRYSYRRNGCRLRVAYRCIVLSPVILNNWITPKISYATLRLRLKGVRSSPLYCSGLSIRVGVFYAFSAYKYFPTVTPGVAEFWHVVDVDFADMVDFLKKIVAGNWRGIIYLSLFIGSPMIHCYLATGNYLYFAHIFVNNNG